MKLSGIYYEQMNKKKEERIWEEQEEPSSLQTVYQCPDCMTVYDKQYGDPHSGISEGTAFAELPETYGCPICEAPKSSFQETEIDLGEEVSQKV